jgi:hypothetical protein
MTSPSKPSPAHSTSRYVRSRQRLSTPIYVHEAKRRLLKKRRISPRSGRLCKLWWNSICERYSRHVCRLGLQMRLNQDMIERIQEAYGVPDPESLSDR